MANIWIVNCKDAVSNTKTADSMMLKLLPLLPDEEQQRARKFKHIPDALRFACGRTMVRKMLLLTSTDIEQQYELLKFSTIGEAGKPALDPQIKLLFPYVRDFNISHDGDWIIAGILNHRQDVGVIGVDLAHIHVPENMSVDNYIKEFTYQLTTTEREILAGNYQYKLQHFYCIWAVKEAYAKAIGMGIALFDLSTINVKLSIETSRVIVNSVTVENKPCPLSFHVSLLDSCTYVYAVATSIDLTQSPIHINTSTLNQVIP